MDLIVFTAYPGVLASSLTLPSEILTAAGQMKRISSRRWRPPRLEIVTLEDAIETLLGREIVDESDMAADMQALARNKYRSRLRRIREGDDESAPE